MDAFIHKISETKKRFEMDQWDAASATCYDSNDKIGENKTDHVVTKWKQAPAKRSHKTNELIMKLSKRIISMLS